MSKARGVTNSQPSTPRGAASSPATARASVAPSNSGGGLPDLDSTMQLPQKHNPTTSEAVTTICRIRPFNVRELRAPVAEIETPASVAAIVSGAAKAAQMRQEAGVAAATDNSVPEPVVDVESDNKTITLLDPQKNYAVKTNFIFDHCFSPFVAVELDCTNHNASAMGSPARKAAAGSSKNLSSDDDDDEAEKEQERIFDVVGKPVVHHAFGGINSCVFAFGQTASGKSYTMLGTKTEPGIIPRVCRAIFHKIEGEALKKQASVLESSTREDGGAAAAAASATAAAASTAHPLGPETVTKIEVVYMEIYNERVRDLLRPRTKSTGPGSKRPKWDVGTVEEEFLSLRVRQHPLHGPFVDGLTKLQVNTWLDCVRLIRQGNELRMTCTTDMNDSSSRSHAIFQILITQTEAFGAKVRGKEIVNHRMSKINLVDLAGSERAVRSNAKGKHATEANYINTSLSTLRKVIDVLNTKRKMKDPAAAEKIVVPYRESLITWILSDNFGGNSRTAMIANVSPHWSCAHETESTLRYATLARGIVNRCRVNEDPSAKLIRELQTQLRSMQDQLQRAGTPGSAGGMTREIEEQMEENKRAIEELSAKENGMMEVIRESREREERLRIEKEGLERDQLRWKREAERLAREKLELLAKLEQIGESPMAPRGAAFWTDHDRGMAEMPSPSLEGLKHGGKRVTSSRGGDGNSGGGQQMTMPRSGGSDSNLSSPALTNPPTTPGGSGMNDSMACPPKQARIVHRRRTSLLNPEDLAQPGSPSTSGGGGGGNPLSLSDGIKEGDHQQHDKSGDSSMLSGSGSGSGDTFLTDDKQQQQQQQQQSRKKTQSRESRNSRQSNRIDSRHGQVDKDASSMLLGSLIGERKSSGAENNNRNSDDDYDDGYQQQQQQQQQHHREATADKKKTGSATGSQRNGSRTSSATGPGSASLQQSPSAGITPSRLAGGSLLAQLSGATTVIGASGTSPSTTPVHSNNNSSAGGGGSGAGSRLNSASAGVSTAASEYASGRRSQQHNFNSTGASTGSNSMAQGHGIPPLPPTRSPPSSRGGNLPLSLQSPQAGQLPGSANSSDVFNATGGSSTGKEIKSGRRRNV